MRRPAARRQRQAFREDGSGWSVEVLSGRRARCAAPPPQPTAPYWRRGARRSSSPTVSTSCATSSRPPLMPRVHPPRRRRPPPPPPPPQWLCRHLRRVCSRPSRAWRYSCWRSVSRPSKSAKQGRQQISDSEHIPGSHHARPLLNRPAAAPLRRQAAGCRRTRRPKHYQASMA